MVQTKNKGSEAAIGQASTVEAALSQPTTNRSLCKLCLIVVVVLAWGVFWPSTISFIAATALVFSSLFCFFFVKSEIAFEYMFRSFLIIIISTMIVNAVIAIIPEVKSDKIASIFVMSIKFISLSFMCLDGFKGAENIAPNHSFRNDPLLLVKGGAIACIAVTLVIFASLFDRVETLVLGMTFLEYHIFSKLGYVILVNFIAISPMILFFSNNLNIIKKQDGEIEGDIKEICTQFFWYINVPALVCSMTIFGFALIMQENGVDVKYIAKIVSGSILFLIFSAMIIGLAIEYNLGYLSKHHKNSA